MIQDFRCPNCRRPVASLLCWCLAASVAAPAKERLLAVMPDMPHIEIASTSTGSISAIYAIYDRRI